jgi:hypothetical protein
MLAPPTPQACFPDFQNLYLSIYRFPYNSHDESDIFISQTFLPHAIYHQLVKWFYKQLLLLLTLLKLL